MSDPEIMGNPEITDEANNHPGPSRRKNIKEVQNLSSASEGTSSLSPRRGGDDKVKETNGKEDQ
jgi:hypothetical protein